MRPLSWIGAHDANQKPPVRPAHPSDTAWLIIGAVAAGQRGYYGDASTNCASVGTIAVTIVAGPLNYMGINPTVDCDYPQPTS